MVRLDRVSPLAIPVMLDIGREFVRNEADEDAMLAETEALLAEAMGEAEPSTEELVIAPGHAQELRRLSRQPGGRRAERTPRRRPRPIRSGPVRPGPVRP